MNTATVEKNEVEMKQSEVQAQAKRRGRPKIHTDVPSYLTCSVTGVVVKTTATQFRKQLERSGLDSETFQKTYVCRAAKTALKQKAQEAKPTETVG